MQEDPLRLSAFEIGGGKVVWPGSPPSADPASAPGGASSPGPSGAAAGGTTALFPRALLSLPPTTKYADAQLDDTQNHARSALRWRPPLRLSLRARTTVSSPRGTFGFGFWNDPFSLYLGMGGAVRNLPCAPQCAWFFYGSPPLDLPLAEGVPGTGWKAATLRFRNIPSFVLAPIAAGGAALASLPPLRRFVFGQARRFYRAEERLLEIDPSQWHTYAIEWRPASAGFFVDGVEMLRSLHPPLPPLGLVLWIDNQYAVASPQKGFGFGVLALAEGQGLELEAARIETGIPA